MLILSCRVSWSLLSFQYHYISYGMNNFYKFWNEFWSRRWFVRPASDGIPSLNKVRMSEWVQIGESIKPDILLRVSAAAQEPVQTSASWCRLREYTRNRLEIVGTAPLSAGSSAGETRSGGKNVDSQAIEDDELDPADDRRASLCGVHSLVHSRNISSVRQGRSFPRDLAFLRERDSLLPVLTHTCASQARSHSHIREIPPRIGIPLIPRPRNSTLTEKRGKERDRDRDR